MTYSSSGNDTEIDFVLVGKEKRKYLRDVKIIPGELQHRLVVVDVEERKLKKSVKKSKRVRWRVWKLQEKEILGLRPLLVIATYIMRIMHSIQ